MAKTKEECTMLDYNIRGENIEVTPAIREHVESKLGKLERYFNEGADASAYVNLKVYKNGSTKVEVTIPMKGVTLRAEERHDDMYAGIDLIVDKLERQIRKYKTRVNRKSREHGGVGELFASLEKDRKDHEEEEAQEDEFQIVRTKRFDLKPMSAEEAILQMNLLDHNFFVYTDGETDETNIVYKRRDGKYGIIETN